MIENVVHEVAHQLESLSAQSLAAQRAPWLPDVQVDVTAPILQASVPQAPEDVSKEVSTPALSELTEMTEMTELTEIDNSILQDPFDLAPASQLISTATHFISPDAPRISYQVSHSGGLVIAENSPRATAVTTKSHSIPALRSPSFERYLAQNSTPKLAASKATNATETTPPSLSVERIMGPKQPIPASILNILEDWHEAHSDTEHPAAMRGRAESTWKNFKVFNDDAEEYELSIFQVSLKQISLKGQSLKRRSVTYRIMIIHAQNGLEELVVYGQPRPKFKGKVNKGTKGIYLLDWLEVAKKGEVQACAIKLWRNDENKIIFSAQFADSGSKCTPLSRPASSTNSTSVPGPASTPKNGAHATDDGYEVDSSSSDQPLVRFEPTPTLSVGNVSTPESKKGDESSVTSPLFRLRATFPPSCYHSRGKPRVLRSPWKPYEKTRRSEHNTNDNGPIPIRYNLVSDVSNQVRIFPTSDARVLFQKAREFYKATDKQMGLLCTVPGIEGARYLGEGCTDEFDILQEDIRKLFGAGTEGCVVEVKSFDGL
ncbi:hypothetical protein N7475_007400 [Penicillium sp. IBT 31633x]|nr:hypothetical protein N7475_007400 [Penicillium sp. IBT 31633x]